VTDQNTSGGINDSGNKYCATQQPAPYIHNKNANMSFFNWFSGKPQQAKSAANNAQHRTHAGPDRPVVSLPRRLAPETPSRDGRGKLKRHARREQLYVAVREAMTRAGVLSGSYKFKVLSLDQPGNEFLVMMDLARAAAGSPGQLVEVEALIVQTAKARFEITVPAVYCRTDDAPASQSNPGNSREAAQRVAPQVGAALAQARAALKVPPVGSARFQPIEADEVAAFKQALQAASPQGASVASVQGVKTRSGPHSYTLLTGFEETEMMQSDSFPALSNTQYGELN